MTSRRELDEIRNWASSLTAEEREPTWVRDAYLWPRRIESLREQLKIARRKLVAVVGVQGVGKTSAMLGLEHSFQNRVVRGRPPSLDTSLVTINWGEMRRFLTGDYPLHSWRFKSFQSKYYEALGKSPPDEFDRSPFLPALEAAESHLNKTQIRKARWNTVLVVFLRASNILIDMPDYSKTDRRLMVNDLESIQTLWRNACEEYSSANFVIFLQKEMFRDHFLFGKMQIVKLEPFTPSQLLDYYNRIHGSASPFTEDSLKLIAKMSGGIFRRFLNYIQLNLENYPNQGKTIGVEDVAKNISEQQLLSDREEELAEIFPKSTQPRLQALSVLQCLETQEATNQKELAKTLKIEEYALSRILDRLELHQKIKREKKASTT